MPGFTGVKGGALLNIGAEALHMAGTGALTGAVTGGVAAAVDGRDITQGVVLGAKDGAIGGVAQTAANVFLFGNTYVPKAGNGGAGQVYRRGFLPLSLMRRGGGLAAGRNLLTSPLEGDPNYYEWVQSHETGHYHQIRRMGFGAFYAKAGAELLGRLRGINPYTTEGTLEYEARQFAVIRTGRDYH